VNVLISEMSYCEFVTNISFCSMNNSHLYFILKSINIMFKRCFEVRNIICGDNLFCNYGLFQD
jgi:hypothetical protein